MRLSTGSIEKALLASFVSLTSLNYAQTLSGTVIAGDTGSPLSGAAVRAIQINSDLRQRPTIYRGITSSTGQYDIAVGPGQYRLCVDDAGLYLDPCQWNRMSVPVLAGIAPVAPLVLTKGAKMILRIHDQNQLLPQVEAFQGSAVSASISRLNRGSFPLPLLYANFRVRDYGAILPVGEPLAVLVSRGRLILADENGAALTAQGLPFQISLSDFQLPNLPASLALKLRPPDVKMVHVFLTGTQ